VIWLRTDDLWSGALEALVIYVRAAAERTGEASRSSMGASPAAVMSGSQR
jgi:hypothetical protein